MRLKVKDNISQTEEFPLNIVGVQNLTQSIFDKGLSQQANILLQPEGEHISFNYIITDNVLEVLKRTKKGKNKVLLNIKANEENVTVLPELSINDMYSEYQKRLTIWQIMKEGEYISLV